MIKAQKLEVGVLFVLAAYFLFIAVNVNQTLGLIYTGFSLAAAIFILTDSKRSVPLKKESDSLFGSIAIGAVAYGVLVVIGTYIIIPGVQKVIDLLGATTPALAGSQFFNNLTFALAVPIAETYLFFIVGLDLFSDLANLRVDKTSLANVKYWIFLIIISLAFMFFHLTAKGITNAPILALVFFMSVISLVLITIFKRGNDALWFHIISNSIPILLGGGLAIAAGM